MDFDGMITSLMRGMSNFFSTKTVVGEPKKVDDTIIIPLVDVTFGMGTGATTGEKKPGGGGGVGGRMTPSSVLVISKGVTKLVNIRNQDAVTKILDMVPDLVNKFTDKADPAAPGVENDDAIEIAFGEDGGADTEF
ncbi:MAG: GerW family sporulation protein [Lachnospiraceae bacterium]|nr:GerW family sporulation protein [Lachnospiraceae bacterium]MBQ2454161.1 GerW family sporulation protein [Lachnospiraceae bacterium]MBQ4243067.1 GerW family sporulation protein [Lachnospiraceae bacterium]MCR4786891.1 GerW family sporulation protein [Lachnospiraceae bacterium]